MWKRVLEPRKIDERGYVELGGIRQWVQVRGTDPAHPVLLVLAGHGLSMVPFTPLLAAWERHFTVVLWDRRAVGRTRVADISDLTFDRLAADGIELIEHLGRGPVVLLGHSQGSVTGVRIARRRPDLVRAYAGLGQMADMPRNEVLAYDWTRRAAESRGRRRVVAGLDRLGRPPYPTPAGWIRRLRYAMAVDPEIGAWQRALLVRPLLMPGLGPRDHWHTLFDAMRLPQGLYDETMAVTPQTLGTRFEVPVVFLHGTDDHYAWTEPAREYLDAIEAPSKEFVPLDGLGHLGPILEPDRLLAELRPRF
ncbi:alpha/beta hydrolase [Dactylosporangium sp. NPDC049140]|uniref:alpha/beta fold hydrolase n=1 Tax=Dactylosporangium sp. NPDC049140 TaxID=3155647 RepID=UPI0033F14EC6